MKYLEGVNELVKESPVYIGTLLRLSPIPLSAKNYGLALMEITFTNYLKCCVIGSIPFVPFVAMMGR